MKSWNDFLGKKIAPSPKAHVPQAIERFEAIPEGVRLYKLREASEELGKRYGRGIKPTTLRNRIKSGRFKPGVHYRTLGNAYHLYLPAVEQALIED